MIFDANEYASAVLLFCEEGMVSHQMQISEFQAVLAGYVALEELSGSTLRAAYVEFDNKYHVQRVVFFLLPISSKGQVASDWLLPLADLAASASAGKDLGGGPIRLACYSQCPVQHLKNQLWDPDLSPKNNQLSHVKRAIQENKLGVAFRESNSGDSQISDMVRSQIEHELSAKLRKEYAQEFRDHMAQLLKEQRLRIATTKEESRQDIFDIKLSYEAKLRNINDQLIEMESVVADLQRQNMSLRETENSLLNKIEAIRGYYEQKLAKAESSEDSYADLQRMTLEAELRAKFEAELRDLRESLQTREVELLYRNELEVQLHDEIARLREQNQEALANTGGQLLQRLIESGISLVSFQPGAGHLTIPLNEVSVYIDDPSSYAAAQCDVSLELYEQWLRHYRMPICENLLAEGQSCGENIERVDAPIDFTPGESNCCETCRKKKARAHLRVAKI